MTDYFIGVKVDRETYAALKSVIVLERLTFKKWLNNQMNQYVKESMLKLPKLQDTENAKE